MPITLIVVLVLVGLAAVWFVLTYNGFVRKEERVDNAWSQVEVQLQRRHDLIPNLVDTVQGYMDHERETLTRVTELRRRARSADSLEERTDAEQSLGAAVGRLINAVAEDYPDLQASDNFQHLQSELSDTEDKISVARQFYNDTVQQFNTGVQVLPASLVAGTMGLEEKPYFDAPQAAEAAVEVQFG